MLGSVHRRLALAGVGSTPSAVLNCPPLAAVRGDLLARLGPHRMGKSCLYLKRLAGIDDAVLRGVIRAGLDDLGRRWTVEPT